MSVRTIYFVDDDPHVLKTITSMAEALGHETLSFGSGDEFLMALPKLEENGVFLDVRMAGTDGLGTLKIVREHWHLAPIVMISGSADIPIAIEAIEHGATMFIEKPITLSRLKEVIEESELRTKSNVIMQLKQVAKSKLPKLSKREIEVSRLLVNGISNREAAEQLDISPRTVEVHRANAMRKLGTQSFAEFVKLCIAGGIDDIEHSGE